MSSARRRSSVSRVGAMSPFGPLFTVQPFLIDESLVGAGNLVFNAGTPRCPHSLSGVAGDPAGARGHRR